MRLFAVFEQARKQAKTGMLCVANALGYWLLWLRSHVKAATTDPQNTVLGIRGVAPNKQSGCQLRRVDAAKARLKMT